MENMNKWPSRMQGQWFFQNPVGGKKNRLGPKFGFLFERLPLPKFASPKTLWQGVKYPRVTV
jgi:hypothetical protein